jgi:hypothetical protein
MTGDNHDRTDGRLDVPFNKRGGHACLLFGKFLACNISENGIGCNQNIRRLSDVVNLVGANFDRDSLANSQ